MEKGRDIYNANFWHTIEKKSSLFKSQKNNFQMVGIVFTLSVERVTTFSLKIFFVTVSDGLKLT